MTSIDVLERRTDWACDIAPVLPWLKSLPSGKVHCWATSPPYFGLRSYLPKDHPDKIHEIGTEDTPFEFADKMVALFGEAKRVLHDSGVLWLNLGDSYAQQGGTGLQGSTSQRIGRKNVEAQQKDGPQRPAAGYKAKDLYGVPWLVAFALREAGWYLRQWMPWVKWNAMSESVEDRPGSACESIFLLSKSPRYYYDHIAVRRPDAGYDMGNKNGFNRPERLDGKAKGNPVSFTAGEGRNFRNNDLWFDTAAMLFNGDGDPLGLHSGVGNFKGAHFASFPREVIEPLILCGSSEKGVCPACGNPWERQFERERVATRPGYETKAEGNEGLTSGNRDPGRHITKYTTKGWEPTCKCGKDAVPAIVGDMFAGTGTTLSIAREHGRVAIGCDIDSRNMKYVHERMVATAPNLMSALLGDTE